MRSWVAVWFGGAMGGLLGGGAVGIVEAIYLLVTAAEVSDYQALPYGALLYGAVGCLLGIGIAVPLHLGTRVVRRPLRPSWAWAVGWTASFCAMGLVAAIWVLRRDFYGEAMPPQSVQNGTVAVFAGIGLVALIVGAGLMERTMLRVVATPVGGLAVYGATVLFLTMMHVGSGHMGTATLPGRAIPPELARRPNVLLIVVDALRTDSLGCYGAEGGLTPAIDAFADEAVVYEEAVAQAPWTRASFASILTSLFPSSHGTLHGRDRLPEDLVTLAEVLSDAGYVTGARVNHIDLVPRFGFQQGFDDYVYLRPAYPLWARESSTFLMLYSVLREALGESLAAGGRAVDRHYQDAEAVTATGAEFMQQHVGERFFLLLHYMDPHEPYFHHPYDGNAVARLDGEAPDPARADELRELYGGEVAHLDEQLRLLWRYMREEGLWDETLVVLTADHGTEFQDHGGWWHGSTLYEEQIHVPLIVKYPRGHRHRSGTAVVETADGDPTPDVLPTQPVEITNGARVVQQVRSIDIAPTVTDLAGRDAPEGWQGVGLTRDWDERDVKDKLAYSEVDHEGNVLASLRTSSWKLIEAQPGGPRGLPACALHDLSVDPTETEDRCGEEVIEDHRLALQAQMEAVRIYTGGHAAEQEDAGMDATTCHRLQELGYVDPAVDCDAL